MNVLAIGEALIDCTEINKKDEYPIFETHPGGAPANFLVAVTKLGVKASIISKVGNDYFGNLLCSTISNNGIDCTYLYKDDNYFTTLAFVSIDEKGNRSFSFARKPGADTQINIKEIDFNYIDSFDVVHFGTLSLTDEPSKTATLSVIDYAKNKNKIISFDPNLRKNLWNNLDIAKENMLLGLEKADIVKISDDEVEFLFGLNPENGVDNILKTFNTSLVFVTCGSKGCYYGTNNIKGYYPALNNINVIDTTGAGDTFGGSAIAKFLLKNKKIENLSIEDLQDIVEYSTYAAGISTTNYGGITSIPDKNIVLNFMKK